MDTLPWKQPTLASKYEFRKTRELTDEMKKCIARYNASQSFGELKQMVQNARESLRQFDLENGLIYFWRGACIGVEAKKKHINTLNNSAGFRELLVECVSESERLTKKLDAMYDKPAAIANLAPLPQPMADKPQPKKVTINHRDREVLTARDIVQRVKSSLLPTTVLIIDYRINTDERVQYIDESLICTAVIPPYALEAGKGGTFKSLLDEMPSQDKGPLTRLSNYDLIVMMGDSTGEKDHRLVKLLECIETCNQIQRQKAHAVLLMEGFQGWKGFYPIYVIGNVAIKPTINDSLDELIADYKKKRAGHDPLSYPSLSPLRPAVNPTVPREPSSQSNRFGAGIRSQLFVEVAKEDNIMKEYNELSMELEQLKKESLQEFDSIESMRTLDSLRCRLDVVMAKSRLFQLHTGQFVKCTYEIQKLNNECEQLKLHLSSFCNEQEPVEEGSVGSTNEEEINKYERDTPSR